MKYLKTLILTALIPFLGFSQSENLLFTSGNWGDTELSTDQLSRLNKIRSNFPTDHIYKVDFGNIRKKQIDRRIEVEVPNDDCEKVIFIAQDVRYISDDNYYWYGLLEPNDPLNEDDCDCEDGYIVLIKRADELFGTIQLETRTYIIESLSNNKNVVVREPDEWTENTICGVDQSSEANHGNNINPAQPRSGGHCDVSVLFVFTESVGNNLANPQNTAENILETTNQALRNSRIDSDELRLRLAGVEEISDVDETNMNSLQGLNAVTSSTETDNLRNLLGADIVLLLINPNIAQFGNVNGRAWVGPSANFAHGVFRAFGFGTTPAHEIAHIFGCRHEPCSAKNPGGNCNDPELPHQQAHSFEFTRKEGCWPFRKEVTHERQTIVFSVSRDTRILHYSNPDVDVEGQPTGIEDERDNSRWLVNNACTVANFRNSNDPYSLSLNFYYDDNCFGDQIDLWPTFDGGCPGMSTWKWYQSSDGVNYSYIPNKDNQNLIRHFPSMMGDMLFIRCESISLCGETDVDFASFTTECDYGDRDFLSTGSNTNFDVEITANPVSNNQLNFTLFTQSEGSFDLILTDLSGRVTHSQSTGNIARGSHNLSIDISGIHGEILFLQTQNGNDLITSKIIRHE